jgi:hypothetical protein
MRRLLITAALAASLALSPVPTFAGFFVVHQPGKTFSAGATGWVWAIFGCSSGTILAAVVANWQQNRQLTWNEAASCGLLFWLTPPKKK